METPTQDARPVATSPQDAAGVAAVPAPRDGEARDASAAPRRPRAVASPTPAGRSAEAREVESLLRRGAGVAGLLGLALIHLLDLPGKLEETRYLGVAYLGLIVAAVVVAEILLRTGSRLAWAAAGGLAAATLAGYVVNRTVGMPGAMDDIGNWLEPLGLASLFTEGVVVLLAVSALIRRPAR